MAVSREDTMVTRVTRLVMFVVVLASLTIAAALPGTAQDATPGPEPDGTVVGGVTVLPPDASWGGATRGEWAGRMWQWAVSMPEAVNPGFDTTGERCGYGQFGPVFFLPGAFVPDAFERTCVVPEGTALYLGAGGSECSTVEPPPFFGRNEEELRACAKEGTDAILELSLTINGEEVPNLEDYRVVSPMFTMTFAEDNFFGVPAGAAWSVADDYSVLVAPLPPGEYEFTGSALFPGESEPFVSTVHVIVVSPQIIEPPAASPEAGTPVASPAA
jgi:hypothetical protein